MAAPLQITLNAQRQLYNQVAFLPAGANLSQVQFWDVGTGNCNSLVDAAGTHFLYYDFGGCHFGKGGPTYPNPAPGFQNLSAAGFAAHPVFLISHWDEDHFFSLERPSPHAGQNHIWIGNRADISSRGRGIVNQECQQLHLVQAGAGGAGAVYEYKSNAGLYVRLVRCTNQPALGNTAGVRRNNNGIALFIFVRTAAARLVDAMDAHALLPANVNDVAGTIALAGAYGTDIYSNLVVRAAQGQAAAAAAASVVTAARNALASTTVRDMTRVAATVVRTAHANPGNANPITLAIFGLGTGDAWVGHVIGDATTAVINQPANPNYAEAQAIAALTNYLPAPGLQNQAALAVIAMQRAALGIGATVANTIAAALPHNNDPYIKAAVGAAVATQNTTPAATPQDVVDAALNALAPPPEAISSIVLTGDAAFQCIPGVDNNPWDILLAYHHGTKEHFIGTHGRNPPRPAVWGESRIVYSSGKNGATRVHGHPNTQAINRYRNNGWTQASYTAQGFGGPRGSRTLNVP